VPSPDSGDDGRSRPLRRSGAGSLTPKLSPSKIFWLLPASSGCSRVAEFLDPGSGAPFLVRAFFSVTLPAGDALTRAEPTPWGACLACRSCRFLLGPSGARVTRAPLPAMASMSSHIGWRVTARHGAGKPSVSRQYTFFEQIAQRISLALGHPRRSAPKVPRAGSHICRIPPPAHKFFGASLSSAPRSGAFRRLATSAPGSSSQARRATDGGQRRGTYGDLRGPPGAFRPSEGALTRPGRRTLSRPRPAGRHASSLR
jgi:hypothetical protein